MKSPKKKVKPKGKNKFIRLDDDNLAFVVRKAKDLDRSQNWIINYYIGKSHRIAIFPTKG